VAKYFFFRALAHETLGNTKQALNDFNICINLDEKYTLAYLERAKLLFSNEQATKGLEDIKKHKELDPSTDSKAHECALYYLGK
jgi:tetratricopeptide (TPR) repeat protein